MTTLEERLAAASRQKGAEIRPGWMGPAGTVNIGGVFIPVINTAHVYVAEGDKVWVVLTKKPDAPAVAVLIAANGEPGPREGTVIAAPSGSSSITVNAGGQSVMATFLASYAPVVNDRVRLLWQGIDCTVLGKVGATAVPDRPKPKGDRPAPPPREPIKGTFDAACSDSSTLWAPGGWESWSGGNQKVHQGTWGGYTVTGAWFYNDKTKKLGGRRIERVRFRLPARLRVGDYNSAGTAHLYYHPAKDRPNGDVNRTIGPHNVQVKPNWRGGLIDLPISFGEALRDDGGGISIAGNPYMGFKGKQQAADSGQLLIDWSD